MSNAMAQRIPYDEAISSGASEIALRLALDEVRQLAAQSGLLALNAAFESAGASDEMDGPGGSAGPAAAEAAKLAGAHTRDIERLLGYKGSEELIHRDDLVVLASR